jgi:succinyl-diaminopimelate desuccinylase
MNVTKVITPNGHNVVPGEAHLIINYRFSPNRSSDSARKILEETVGNDVQIEYLDDSPSAYASPRGFHTMKDGVQKGILRGWTDVAQLINAGIPAVNFGPGSLQDAHKPSEYICVSELNAFYENLKTHL